MPHSFVCSRCPEKGSTRTSLPACVTAVLHISGNVYLTFLERSHHRRAAKCVLIRTVFGIVIVFLGHSSLTGSCARSLPPAMRKQRVLRETVISETPFVLRLTHVAGSGSLASLRIPQARNHPFAYLSSLLISLSGAQHCCGVSAIDSRFIVLLCLTRGS